HIAMLRSADGSADDSSALVSPFTNFLMMGNNRCSSLLFRFSNSTINRSRSTSALEHVVGIGTDNGLERAASVLNKSVPEVMNRTAITGSIDVGRYPGTMTITFLAPIRALEKAGLSSITLIRYSSANC